MKKKQFLEPVFQQIPPSFENACHDKSCGPFPSRGHSGRRCSRETWQLACRVALHGVSPPDAKAQTRRANLDCPEPETKILL